MSKQKLQQKTKKQIHKGAQSRSTRRVNALLNTVCRTNGKAKVTV